MKAASGPNPELMGRRALLRHLVAFGALTLLASTLVAGCARPVDLNQPPEIGYGRDVCVRCGMIISEPAYAAAYRLADGEARLFDDAGEMVQYDRQQREEVATFFVHDYESKAWLKAEAAWFVQSPTFRTPMGSGVVALGDEAKAKLLAHQLSTQALTFSELLEHATLGED